MPKETINIEYKSSFNDAVIETITAFANTKGGKVLVGVDNNGTPIKGFMIGDETFQQWLNEIKNKTSPSVIPDITEVRQLGHIIAEISIPEFPIKPIAFRGRYFKRVGNSNHLLSAVEIADLSLKSLQVSWDSYPTVDKTMDDLDETAIVRFIDKVNDTGRFNLSGNNRRDNLTKLRLLKDNTVTQAAYLLFGKENIGYNVHIGRFKTPSLIIDDKIFHGNLFRTVEDAMQYITGHLKVAYGYFERCNDSLRFAPSRRDF